MNGRMEGPKLRQLLFGQDHVPEPLSGAGQLPVAEDRVTPSLGKSAASAPAQDDSIRTKKQRLMHGWEGQKHDSGEVTNNVSWPSTQPLVYDYQARQFGPGLPQLPFSTFQSPGFSPLPSTETIHGWAGQQYASGAITTTASGPFTNQVLQQLASAPLQTMLLPHGLQGSMTTVPWPPAEPLYMRHTRHEREK